MRVIERLPPLNELAMIGIAIKAPSIDEYVDKWLSSLSSLSQDSSFVDLRVLYYDEISFANNRAADVLEPIA